MITYDQAVNENEFHAEGKCHRTIGPRGGVRQTSEVWRRNGKTQVWKTRPGDFRLPIKFGLRSYDQLTPGYAHAVHTAGDCPLNDPNWEG